MTTRGKSAQPSGTRQAARGHDPTRRAGRRTHRHAERRPAWTTSCRWFRKLPADQRSWVSLVAQAGIASFVEWLRTPDDVLRLTGEVFRAAPRELARSVTLQQTVELVQMTILVTEEQLPQIADDDDGWLANELLRFSREIAFAAARVYAGVAETRGAWDVRLEALVIDGLVRGGDAPDAPLSQIAALGWRTHRTGHRDRRQRSRRARRRDLLAELHRVARHDGLRLRGRRPRHAARDRRRRRARPRRARARPCSPTSVPVRWWSVRSRRTSVWLLPLPRPPCPACAPRRAGRRRRGRCSPTSCCPSGS